MDLTKFKSELSLPSKVLRLVWGICWFTLFLPSPRLLHAWRRFLLKLFGAKVGRGVKIYNTAKVFFPPNLILGDGAVVGPYVDLYCVAKISVAENSMISQYSYLCAASHDYTQVHLPLISKPIVIGPRTWVCARAFVGPGVTIGTNCLIAACSVVVKDVTDGQIMAGNPARFIKERIDLNTNGRRNVD